MARYKSIHKGLKLLPVDFDRQVTAGSAPAFEPATLFAQVLLICDRQGLIGRVVFAIDGVKLPSNASKAKSGTRKDVQRQLTDMETAAQKIVDTHRQADTAPRDDVLAQRDAKKLARLQKQAHQLRTWLAKNKADRQGAKGGIRLSNRTDNDSAKVATSKGVIQGYTGVAAVDEKSQIIIDAQAHGTGSEQELLAAVVSATDAYREPTTVMTADAGYHSEANLKTLAARQIDAYIPRRRDGRYADQDIHNLKLDSLWTKTTAPKKSPCFSPNHFTLADDHTHCLCRPATVEPVFGHLRGNKRLNRFTLRGKTKVDGQWKLFCLMHNIEKPAKHGYALP